MFSAEDIDIHVVYVGPNYFIISWSLSLLDHSHDCVPALSYHIKSSNCGNCSHERLFATCSDFKTTVEGRQCFVYVYAEICKEIRFNNSISTLLKRSYTCLDPTCNKINTVI